MKLINHLIGSVLLPVHSEMAKTLLYMVDHTIIFRTKKNRSFIRNVEREAIKVINGDKSSVLIAKYDITRLINLYEKHK